MDLLLTRDYQDLFRKHMTLSNMAKISSLCKDTKGVLCNKDDVRKHVEKTNSQILVLKNLSNDVLRTAESLEEGITSYYTELDTEQNSLLFLFTFIVMAFFLDNEDKRKNLHRIVSRRRVSESDDDFNALQLQLFNFLMNQGLREVVDVLTRKRYLNATEDPSVPEGLFSHGMMVFIDDLVRRRRALNIDGRLSTFLGLANKLVVVPARAFKQSLEDYKVQKAKVLKLVDKLGKKDLMRHFHRLGYRNVSRMLVIDKDTLSLVDPVPKRRQVVYDDLFF